MAKTRERELSLARPPQLSACGGYLAVPLSSKRLKGLTRSQLDASQRERVYEQAHAFCILNLKKQTVSMRQGRVENFRWV